MMADKLTLHRNKIMANKKEVKNCEAELTCKATAALEEEIKDDLKKADWSLKELLENDKKENEDD